MNASRSDQVPVQQLVLLRWVRDRIDREFDRPLNVDELAAGVHMSAGHLSRLFSANSEGACPVCNGAGIIYSDLGTMAGMSAPRDVCEGKGLRVEVLEYTLAGKNIREVLDLPVTAAIDYSAAGESRIPAAS